jgi:hypothetical protein
MYDMQEFRGNYRNEAGAKSFALAAAQNDNRGSIEKSLISENL